MWSWFSSWQFHAEGMGPTCLLYHICSIMQIKNKLCEESYNTHSFWEGKGRTKKYDIYYQTSALGLIGSCQPGCSQPSAHRGLLGFFLEAYIQRAAPTSQTSETSGPLTVHPWPGFFTATIFEWGLDRYVFPTGPQGSPLSIPGGSIVRS